MTLVMTCVHMLLFTRHYKDTIQERLTILRSFCFKFGGVQVCKKSIKIELDLTKLLQKYSDAVC